MHTANRGGLILDTGEIGVCKILRQELILPGETQKSHIQGEVRLEALRERDVSRINVRFDRYYTPVRWLWAGYPDWLRGGPDVAGAIPSSTLNAGYVAALGLGSSNSENITVPTFFVNSVLRVFNEHYKWPEAADLTAVPATGLRAQPLPMPWNRCRDSNLSDGDDYELQTAQSGAREKIDIRQLEQIHARFRRAIDDEFVSFGRWKEYLDERYGTSGTSEVDQVPYHVEDHEMGVQPKSMPAMDGPSRGQYMSVYDFPVNIHCDPFSANEHMVMTDVMLVRYASITENDGNYLAFSLVNGGWKLFSGDPGIHEAEPIQAVTKGMVRGYTGSNDNDVLGYLPYGWPYRSRWNQIGLKIDERNSFPLYRDTVSSGNAAARRDATRVQNAYSSKSFDDYVVDLHYDHICHMPLPGAKSGPGQGLADLEPHRLV